MESDDPRAIYSARLRQTRDQIAVLESKLDRIGMLRLAVAGLGVIFLLVVFWWRLLGLEWLGVPIIGLVALFAWYGRLKARRAYWRRVERFYEVGLERLDNAWAGRGDDGARFLDRHHLYAADLDLFGRGSLFERLCIAHTQPGQNRLADWLINAASATTIRRRQESMRDLRERVALRERLAVLGNAIPGGIDTSSLTKWAVAPPELPHRRGWLVVHLFNIAVGMTVLGWALFGWGPAPLLLTLIVQIGFALWMMPQVNRVLTGIDRRAADLLELAGILAAFEAQLFSAPQLLDLQKSLQTDGVPASQQIAHLHWLIDMLNSRRNQFFLPVALMMLWGTRMAFAIDAWRLRTGAKVEQWFDAIAELEAILCLAAYSFENPLDVVPDIDDAGVMFEGEDLRHPLMPRSECIANDLALGSELRLLVVSGSNMSGKSTWLRTVGTNAVLALAGAPVRASRLRIAPLQIGATMRVQDSLQENESRFYAEILRIRAVVEKAKGPLPVLFLFDEVLHGTNSHDRGIGAEAIVKALVERGAIGLISTHDLTLTRIAEDLAQRAANVHFADRLEDGRMIFDYRMQPGVVRHSNALALMRAVGLPV